MMGPRQRIYRASCRGVEIRLRVNVDSAWVTISQPGQEPFYRDIAESEVAGVLAEFHAIGKDAEKFEALASRLLREATGAFNHKAP